MPIGASQLIALVIMSTLATVTRVYRLALMITTCIVSMIGIILVMSLSVPNGRLVGVYLADTFAANIPISLSLIASNVGGFTKRSTINGMLFIGYSVGNIVGPQMYLAHEAPGYKVRCLSGPTSSLCINSPGYRAASVPLSPGLLSELLSYYA